MYEKVLMVLVVKWWALSHSVMDVMSLVLFWGLTCFVHGWECEGHERDTCE